MNAFYTDFDVFETDAVMAGFSLARDDFDPIVTLALDGERTAGYWDPMAGDVPGLLADSAREFEAIMFHHSNHC